MKYNRILLIGGDTSITRPAIYLHVIWTSSEPDRFLLYGGQSLNLPDRVKNHEDPHMRERYPSLHYFATEAPGSEGQFIVLANVETEEYPYRGLIQNILEMWACLMFFTLLKDDLTKYLPKDIQIPRAMIGLNFALPPWQGSPGHRAGIGRFLEGIFHLFLWGPFTGWEELHHLWISPTACQY